ncbi:HDOD domain-containing protein [soil metagenome]
MIITDDTSAPVATLMPVVNSKQQLAALLLGVKSASFHDALCCLHQLKASEFFDKLPAIPLLVPVLDAASLPADLDERISPSQITLCVREASCADAEIQTKLNYLVSKGFAIVVDDFSSKSSLLWENTKNISIDCHDGLALSVHAWLLRFQTGKHLARNISTPLQMQETLSAGFTLFAGDYAFSPPEKNKSSDSSARTRLLKLLGLVSRDAESRELEALIKQDTTLSFMLFKLVSSAAFAQTVKVVSFSQAINLLGRRQLQRWLQLLLYARQEDNSGVLNPLMLRAAFRASLMEAICQKQGGNKDEQDCAFMIGMFSLLDILFGSPLNEILLPLNLTDDVLNALLHKNGDSGQQLALAEVADRQNTEQLDALLKSLNIDVTTYYQCMTNAYVWTNQVCQDM